jgi:hypothetical protein
VKLIGKIQSISLHLVEGEADGAIQRRYMEGIPVERKTGEVQAARWVG